MSVSAAVSRPTGLAAAEAFAPGLKWLDSKCCKPLREARWFLHEERFLPSRRLYLARPVVSQAEGRERGPACTVWLFNCCSNVDLVSGRHSRRRLRKECRGVSLDLILFYRIYPRFSYPRLV
jgi:hypothetical protein